MDTTTVPQLAATVVEVADLDRSVALYRDGFGVDLEVRGDDGCEPWGQDPWTGGRRAVSRGDGAVGRLELHESRHRATQGAQVVFVVTDLPTAHRRALVHGAIVVHGPRTDGGCTAARYRDPDGNVVALVQSPT